MFKWILGGKTASLLQAPLQISGWPCSGIREIRRRCLRCNKDFHIQSKLGGPELPGRV